MSYCIRFRELAHSLVLIGAIALILRLVLAPSFVAVMDFSFWHYVCESAEAGNGLYQGGSYWYTPPWGLMLLLINFMLNLFGIRTDGTMVQYGVQYDSVFASYVSDPAFNIAVKLPLIICDIIVAYLLYRITLTVTDSERGARFAFIAWCFCPLTIWMSAIQGQFDCVSIMFMAAMLYCILERKHFLGGLCFGLAVAIKFIPAVLFLVVMASIVYRHGEVRSSRGSVMQFVFGALCIAAVVFIPTMLHGELIESFAFLSSRVSMLDTGGGSLAAWINVVFVLPIIVLLEFYVFRNCYNDNPNDFRTVVLFTFGMSIMFMFPIAQPVPQYMLYCLLFILILSDRLPWMKHMFALITVIGIVSVASWAGFSIFLPLVEMGVVSEASLYSLSVGSAGLMNLLQVSVQYVRFIPFLICAVVCYKSLRGDPIAEQH